MEPQGVVSSLLAFGPAFVLFFPQRIPCLALLNCVMEDPKFLFLFNVGSQLRDFLESHMRFF